MNRHIERELHSDKVMKERLKKLTELVMKYNGKISHIHDDIIVSVAKENIESFWREYNECNT